MRIAVLANLKSNAPAEALDAPDAWAELDGQRTVDAVVDALHRAGHEAQFFEGDLSLVERLPRFRPDLCFNLCEGHHGDSRESHIPAILEMLRVPYTGSGVLALAVTLDKPTTKQALVAHGIPTPPSQVFYAVDDALDPALRFPLFVKPSKEGSGMGVAAESVVRDLDALRARVDHVLTRYRQPALVERFIRGREITIGLFGNRGATVVPEGSAWSRVARVDGMLVLPAYEINHDGLPASEGGVYTHHVKGQWEGAWVNGRNYHCPARLDAALGERLAGIAVATFHATGCRDVGRVDIRLDADDGDRPYVLEINALPGVAPGVSDLCHEAAAAGLDHDALITGILAQAIARVTPLPVPPR